MSERSGRKLELRSSAQIGKGAVQLLVQGQLACGFPGGPLALVPLRLPPNDGLDRFAGGAALGLGPDQRQLGFAAGAFRGLLGVTERLEGGLAETQSGQLGPQLGDAPGPSRQLAVTRGLELRGDRLASFRDDPEPFRLQRERLQGPGFAHDRLMAALVVGLGQPYQRPLQLTHPQQQSLLFLPERACLLGLGEEPALLGGGLGQLLLQRDPAADRSR